MAYDNYTLKVNVSNLNINDYAFLNGLPCQIDELKMDDEKLHVTGRDIFTNEIYQQSFNNGEIVMVPKIEKTECQVNNTVM
ncbi:hypothetical protein B4U80_12468 [Leptotrombidium deliense]|uniref:Uncharacterized protein n=1 Tax=Leptotrombidium deliense TaxID=299467 RepID=A0A443RTJ0_9ACAR|nr:hypothetical protein B4U80_12468 [Leptotrombidium deliense]